MEGEFLELQRTAKLLMLKRIKSGFYAQYPNMSFVKIPIGNGKSTRFCPAVYEWEDGGITVYHESRGIPFHYSPVVQDAIC